MLALEIFTDPLKFELLFGNKLVLLFKILSKKIVSQQQVREGSKKTPSVSMLIPWRGREGQPGSAHTFIG